MQRPRNRQPDPSLVLLISKADLAIFEVLKRYPGIHQHFIGELLGYSKTTKVHEDGRAEVRYEYLRKRLQRLRDADYIAWPPGSLHAANHRYKPACYALRPKGETELRRAGRWKETYRHLSNDFAHDFGSSVVPASFELGTKQRGIRYIETDELLRHPDCPEETRLSSNPFAIPIRVHHNDKQFVVTKKHDGAPWGIAIPKPGGGERKIYFFLEFDRDTEQGDTDDFTRSSVRKHLRHIFTLLRDDCAGYRKRFGTRFYVLIVTINAVRKEEIKRLIMKYTQGAGAERVLLKHIPDFMAYEPFPTATGWALAQPWERAGHPPLDLLELLGAKPVLSTFAHAS